MHKSIVYVVHGADKFYVQARLSILTLLDLLFKQARDDYQVVVYCDRPALLPRHPFVCPVLLAPARLAEWRLPTGYIHRVKIAVLRELATQSRAPFVYVDSDTRWLRLPDAEFDEMAHADAGGAPPFFMHVLEGDVSPRFYPYYFRYLTRHAAARLAAWGIGTGPWRIWNSGVIGVSPAAAGTFFDDALTLCDLLYLYLRPRHIVEQCAIALLADRRYHVRPFDHCLHHYWPYSAEAPAYLGRLLAGLSPAWAVERQADYCGRLEWEEATLRAMQTAPAHRLRCWVRKQRTSVFKRALDLKVFRLRLARRRALAAR